MRVVMSHILPNYPAAVYVQWDLENIDPARASGVTFAVQRSGSPRGEWETRASGLTVPYYRDEWADDPNETTTGVEGNLLSLQREVWYRVQATLADGEVLTSLAMDNDGHGEPTLLQHQPVGLKIDDDQPYTDPVTALTGDPRLQKRLVLIRRAQIRKALINLQKFAGANMAVLKLRHFGTRCLECTHSKTKAIIVANCSSCYGTSWVDGYWPAFPTVGRFIEAPVSSNLESAGRTHVQHAQLSVINFPRLEKNDLIVELRSNQRWRVVDGNARNFKRQRVTQEFTVSELDRSAVEYAVPVELPVPSVNSAIAP